VKPKLARFWRTDEAGYPQVDERTSKMFLPIASGCLGEIGISMLMIDVTVVLD
jgi:hypothetical protein